MSALAVRRSTRPLRRHAAGAFVVLALGAIVAVHHIPVAHADMHHPALGTMAELCLGVATGAAVAVAVSLSAQAYIWRWHAGRVLRPPLRLATPRATSDPRAGPSAQPLLCVWRR